MITRSHHQEAHQSSDTFVAIVVYSVCVAVLYSLEIACRLRKLYVILINLVSLSNLRLLTLISIVGQLKADIANVHIAGVFYGHACLETN